MRILAVIIVLAVWLLPRADAQETPGGGAQTPAAPPVVRHRLVHRVSRGLVYTVELLRTKHLRYRFANVEGGAGDEKAVPAEVEHTEHELWTDVFRKVEGGKPRRIERRYQVHAAVSYIRSTDQRTAQRNPLHGRSVVLERDARNRWRVTGPAGKLLPTRLTAGVRPFPLIVSLLPRQPIAVGQRWKLDPATVQALLSGKQSGAELKVRKAWGLFERLGREGSRRIAHLRVHLSWAARHRRVLVFEATLGGPIVVDLSAERVLRADLSGRLRMETGPGAKKAGMADTRLEGPYGLRFRILQGRPRTAPAPKPPDPGRKRS